MSPVSRPNGGNGLSVSVSKSRPKANCSCCRCCSTVGLSGAVKNISEKRPISVEPNACRKPGSGVTLCGYEICVLQLAIVFPVGFPYFGFNLNSWQRLFLIGISHLGLAFFLTRDHVRLEDAALQRKYIFASFIIISIVCVHSKKFFGLTTKFG